MQNNVKEQEQIDFHFINHFSICTLEPLTQEAENWINDNIDPDCQKWGNAIVIEPRYAENILNGLSEQGLTFHV